MVTPECAMSLKRIDAPNASGRCCTCSAVVNQAFSHSGHNIGDVSVLISFDTCALERERIGIRPGPG